MYVRMYVCGFVFAYVCDRAREYVWVYQHVICFNGLEASLSRSSLSPSSSAFTSSLWSFLPGRRITFKDAFAFANKYLLGRTVILGALRDKDDNVCVFGFCHERELPLPGDIAAFFTANIALDSTSQKRAQSLRVGEIFKSP